MLEKLKAIRFSDFWMALYLLWVRVKAKIEFGPLWSLSTARYFLSLATLALLGKIMIVETHLGQGKGGYKYFVVVLSKMPLSNKHTYEDLGAEAG